MGESDTSLFIPPLRESSTTQEPGLSSALILHTEEGRKHAHLGSLRIILNENELFLLSKNRVVLLYFANVSLGKS